MQKYLYYRILHNHQVVQLPIANDCPKVSIGSHSEKQIVPDFNYRCLTKKIHNIIISPSDEGGLKGARDKENNIIISDSTLCNILPYQLNNISAWYKLMCACECCISAKIMHSSLLSWWDCYLKN